MEGEDSSSHAGGAGDSAQTGSADGDGKVDRKTYEKTVTEAKTLKQQLAEERSKNKKFEDERKAAEEQDRIAKNQHLQIIEEQKLKITELSQQNENHQRDKQDIRKLNTALGLLQEKGVQLEPKYYNMIPLDQIVLDADGRPDKTSVAKVVSDFTKDHPRLVVAPGKPLPTDRPDGGIQQISIDAWGKLPYKEKMAALREGRVKK